MSVAVALPPHVDGVNRVSCVPSTRLLVILLARTCDSGVTSNAR